MKDNLLSVIIPCFNVENYIEACINSILSQTYKNIEIIVVNDGSTDGTLKILQDKFESKITLIDIPNQGVSNARNMGIKVAKGNYIALVDGDDMVTPDTYEVCLNALKSDPAAEVVQFPTHFFFNDGGPIVSKRKKTLSSPVKIYHALLKEKLGFSVWNKVFKKELIENIKFQINLRYEDMHYMASVAAKAKRIVMIKEGLYLYRKVSNSFINSPLTPIKIEDYLKCRIAILQFGSAYPSLIFERQKFIINTFKTKEVKAIDKFSETEKKAIMILLKELKPNGALCFLGFLLLQISLRKLIACCRIRLT